MKIGWLDKIADTSLSASGLVTDKPAENAQVNPVALPARKTDTSITIGWDYGSQTDWDLIAAIAAGQGGDPTSAATYQLKLSNLAIGNTDVFDSGSTAAGAIDGYPDIYIQLSSTQTARYGELTITDNSKSFIDVGRLVGYGGDGYWEPSIGQAYGERMSWRDDSDIRKTLGRQRLERPLPRWRQGRFRLEANTESAVLGNAFEIARQNGIVTDVLLMLRPNDYQQKRTIFGPIVQVQEFEHWTFDTIRVEYTVEQRL